MNKNLATIRARPGFYLHPHNNGVDAASFILNFLVATLQTVENKIPSSIHITVANDFFYIQANDFALPLSLDEASENLPLFFELPSFKDPFHNKPRSFMFICPILFCSEHCLIHTSINNKVFRQAFIDGEPVTKVATATSSSNEFLGIFFTIPASIFLRTTLDANHLKSIIASWEKDEFKEFVKSQKLKMTLKKKWNKLSNLHYSLTITPVLRTSENNTG